MSKFHFQTHIAAPPERVFQIASDIPSAPQRFSGITRVEPVTPGPVGRGYTWRETRLMFKKECTETLEMTEFDPPRSYTVGCESCGAIWTSVFRFLPEAGGTRAEVDITCRSVTFMAKLMGAIMTPLMAGAMRKCIESDLADLKAACERGGVAPDAQPAMG